MVQQAPPGHCGSLRCRAGRLHLHKDWSLHAVGGSTPPCTCSSMSARDDASQTGALRASALAGCAPTRGRSARFSTKLQPAGALPVACLQTCVRARVACYRTPYASRGLAACTSRHAARRSHTPLPAEDAPLASRRGIAQFVTLHRAICRQPVARWRPRAVRAPINACLFAVATHACRTAAVSLAQRSGSRHRLFRSFSGYIDAHET